jgi:Acetyl-CoA acetyltransferase
MVVGGQESMSQAPHAAYMREGTKMGELKMTDTMLKDGLWDAFHGYHMGNTAENVAQKYQITRAEQDAFAAVLAEQGRGGAEVRPLQGRDRPGHVKTRKGDVVVDTDEFPRHGTTVETLASCARFRQGRLGHRRQRLGHQ